MLRKEGRVSQVCGWSVSPLSDPCSGAPNRETEGLPKNTMSI